MRSTKQLTLGTVLGLAALIGTTWWLSPATSNIFDRDAARQIRRLCGKRPACEVRLRDVIPQRFDTYYVFNFDVSDPAIRRLLGTKDTVNHELQRNIVLTRNGRVVLHEYASMGIEKPLANQVILECPTEENGWMECRADEIFRVSTHAAAGTHASPFSSGGTWYELTEVR